MIIKLLYSLWLAATLWDDLSLHQGHPDPLGLPFWAVCTVNALAAIGVIFRIFTSGQERAR